MTRVATPGNEALLLDWARSSTDAQLEQVCARYRRVKRYQGRMPIDEPEARYVHQKLVPSGLVQVVAQLLPEEAAIVMKAIEAARERTPQGSAEISAEISAGYTAPRDGERRDTASRVDALVWLAEAVLAGAVSEEPRPTPVEVVVHVEKEELARPDCDPEATLDDGRRLEPEATARLLCDSAIVEVVEDEHGTPLDIGRRRRAIPAALKRALRLRDGGCRFPGCTLQRTDGHHVVPWSRGGDTALGNLVSLCRRHHRFVHEVGWRIDVREGNELLFYDERDTLVPSAAPRDAIRHDVAAALRAQLADQGIDIDATTSIPRWDGYAPDYGMAIEALLARDRPEAADAEDISAETRPGEPPWDARGPRP